MTVRTAAALIAMLAFAGPAAAAPACQVTVMGLTFDQCRTETVVTAPRSSEALARAERADAAQVTTTGSIGNRHRTR